MKKIFESFKIAYKGRNKYDSELRYKFNQEDNLIKLKNNLEKYKYYIILIINNYSYSNM